MAVRRLGRGRGPTAAAGGGGEEEEEEGAPWQADGGAEDAAAAAAAGDYGGFTVVGQRAWFLPPDFWPPVISDHDFREAWRARPLQHAPAGARAKARARTHTNARAQVRHVYDPLTRDRMGYAADANYCALVYLSADEVDPADKYR